MSLFFYVISKPWLRLKAARARLDQTATTIEQAWVALLPQLSTQGKYTHN